MIANLKTRSFGIVQRATRTVAPGLYRRVSYHRNEGRCLRISQKLVKRYGRVVLDGPFRGMKYVSKSVGSVYNAKLVGCYEAELHPALEAALRKDYDTVVNVGCAEGYYAVGLLVRLPKARGIAFDGDAAARHLCRELAEMNAVSDRLKILGVCDPDALRCLDLQRALVLCDCEGGETTLLDPANNPGLKGSDLIVELHDFILPQSSDCIRTRFASTHHVQLIEASQKDPKAYPQLAFLGPKDRWMAVQEYRPVGVRWAVLESRARA